MTGLDEMMKLWESPNAEGRDGIHISAQLRIDAMQLERHRIAWAARTMNTAAERIDELEKMIVELKTAKG